MVEGEDVKRKPLASGVSVLSAWSSVFRYLIWRDCRVYEALRGFEEIRSSR